MDKEIRKNILSIIFVSIFLVVMTVYVYLPKQKNLLSAFAFIGQQQSFYMEDLSDGVLLRSAVPIKDSEGIKNQPYTFRVVNNTDREITYNIILKNDKYKIIDQGKEPLSSKYIKYAISDTMDSNCEIKNLTENGILLTTTIKPYSKDTFNFRMWLDYDAGVDAMNKMFIGTIEVKNVK